MRRHSDQAHTWVGKIGVGGVRVWRVYTRAALTDRYTNVAVGGSWRVLHSSLVTAITPPLRSVILRMRGGWRSVSLVLIRKVMPPK